MLEKNVFNEMIRCEKLLPQNIIWNYENNLHGIGLNLISSGSKKRSISHNPLLIFCLTIVKLNEESSLSQIEQHFLDQVSQLAHDNMFKNQRQINKFIQVAFKIYCSDIDNMAYKKVITLKDTPWNPSFLDLIDTTLFSWK